MATIIIKNSTGSNSTPSSLQQGELAINTVTGKLFYGSGSGNAVKEFAGGSGTPGGSNTQVQFNASGAFSGSSNFTFDSASNALTLTGSFNHSGSLIQIGDYTHTGSVYHSGSKFLIGVFSQTGSMNITGSTTQIGNNTLLGNTLLTGSITISGSNAPGSVTASVQIYGDIRQSGYHRFDPVITNIDTSISASYIYVSGSTQDLYFSQNGSGYNNVTRLRWLEGNLYTGLLHGGLITTQSSTVYQVASGSGIIVNLNASIPNDPYPIIQFLQWDNLTKTIDALSASFDQQFVAVNSSSQIVAQGIPFSDGQFNTLIPIGLVLHQNHSTINGVKTQPSVAYGWKQRSSDFIRAFGPLKASGFTVLPSGSSTGSLTVGSGTAFVDGANYVVDPNNPSYAVDSGTTTSKIFRYYQSGSDWVYNTNNGAGYATLDPVYYNPGGLGVLETVGTSNYSLQRVFWYPNSVTKAITVYYGNARYGTLTQAVAAIASETFNEAPNTAANAVYLGTFAIKGGTNTTLQNTTHFTWLPGGLFRAGGSGGGGGGGGSTTLAGLTDVSITSPSYGDLLMYDTTVWNNTKTLSGSYTLSGSLHISGSITGSLLGTASYVTGSIFTNANPALSASYALTASYAANAGSTFNSTSSIIGDGASTSYNINHGFNTRNLHITVYESGSNGETVYPDIRRINANTASIIFANPPISNEFIVYISQ